MRTRLHARLKARLAFYEHPHGVETEPGSRVVYDLQRGEAHFGSARVGGAALEWELFGSREREAQLAARVDLGDGSIDWVLRCDRIDFPPGSVAYRHTHPGPGIRRLLFGELKVDAGGHGETYKAGDAWFESGPEPVFAAASETEETGFVRVMLLPAEWAGKRTIRYVDPSDEEKPKRQQARILLERAVER